MLLLLYVSTAKYLVARKAALMRSHCLAAAAAAFALSVLFLMRSGRAPPSLTAHETPETDRLFEDLRVREREVIEELGVELELRSRVAELDSERLQLLGDLVTVKSGTSLLREPTTNSGSSGSLLIKSQATRPTRPLASYDNDDVTPRGGGTGRARQPRSGGSASRSWAHGFAGGSGPSYTKPPDENPFEFPQVP